MSKRSRQTLEQLVTLPDLGMPLAESALLISCEEYPQLLLQPYLDQLDRMADRVRAALTNHSDPLETIERINHVLFVEYGFRGNTSNYYDPRNSFLNDVIDRRIGIPITLSTVYLETARRLEFPIDGVGIPGHFILKYRSGNEEIFLDPFNAGSLLTRQQCLKFVSKMDLAKEEGEQWLNRLTNRQMLNRIINNLRLIYLKSGSHKKALAMVDLMVLIEPGTEELYKHRGLLRFQVGQFHGARMDLNRYLENRLDTNERKVVEGYLKELHAVQATMN